MKKRNIALIGFMGTGKTAIAGLLGEKLQKKVVEIDDLVEKRAGKTISQIFEERGEIRFRALEAEAIKTITEMDDVVISCGGGAMINRINAERLKKNAIVILLVASPGAILERTSRDDKRPLLNVADRLERIDHLLKEREPFYREIADYRIDTTGLDENAVVEKILTSLGKEDDEGNS